MQKIVPQLWFDTQAKEAVAFYLTVFPNSRLVYSSALEHAAPVGSVDVLGFILGGLEFGAISAGPLFKANASMSFMVNYDPSQDPQAQEHLDQAWAKLSEGGTIMMPLQEYPFSKHYGWVEDRFGVSWQLMLTNPGGEPRPFIMPSLLFTPPVAGKAEEALRFYTSVFPGSKMGTTAHYPAGSAQDKEGTLMFGEASLSGEWLIAMDSGYAHGFNFNEALSLLVRCEDQKEVDYYWNTLLADGGTESQCGWLKDKFGLSWQIVPKMFDDVMASGDKAKIARLVETFMPMVKLDVAALEKAMNG